MRVTKRLKIFMMSAFFIGLMASFHLSAFAAGETDELKAQIKILNERIAGLEKKLAETEGSPAIASSGSFRQTSPGQWDPFREMQSMQRRMNQMFDDTFDRGMDGFTSGLVSPKMDIKEEPGQYVIAMDLPGMSKDSINVEVKNGALVVSAKRSAQTENKGNQFYSQERSFGQLMKTMTLPDDAKADDVHADYKNGVLQVRVGRLSGARVSDREGRKIKVN